MGIHTRPENFSGQSTDVLWGEATPSLDDNKLNTLAEDLPAAELEREYTLRKELLDAERNLWVSRYDKGRILSEYRALYRPLGKWQAFCKAVCVNDRTALNLITDFIAARGIPKAIREAALNRNIDLSAKKYRRLLREIVDYEASTSEGPDQIVESCLIGLRRKPAPSPCGQRRLERAYKAMQKIYDAVDQEVRNPELLSLFDRLAKFYSIPQHKRSMRVSVGQELLIPNEVA